ncbi:hypothetical protein DMENIID0001_091040 [Sergentomyia squamirostris]
MSGRTNSRTKWNSDEDTSLLSLIQKERVLWDKRQFHYRNNAWKEKKWKGIDEQLKKPYGSSECRYKNLREQYRQALSKEEAQARSGAGQIDVPPWKYMNQMAFLKNTFLKRASASNIPSQLPSISSPSYSQNPGFEPTVKSECPHSPTVDQDDPLEESRMKNQLYEEAFDILARTKANSELLRDAICFRRSQNQRDQEEELIPAYIQEKLAISTPRQQRNFWKHVATLLEEISDN